MNISYWDCEFGECDDYWDDEEGQIWIYACTHKNNKEKYCHLNNKWGCAKDDCKLLDSAPGTTSALPSSQSEGKAD